MPNNPVQVVLNAQNYVQKVEVTPGGNNKEFYQHRDGAFVAHKNEIAKQISSLPPPVVVSLQYARVEFEDAGWAKSHRPNRALFPSTKIRTIGGE